MGERFLLLLTFLAVLILVGQALRRAREWQARRIVAGDEAARDRPTLLYFWSLECAPCKYQQWPIIERLRQEWGNAVLIRSMDAVAHPDLARHYGVLSVPTTIVVSREGQVVRRNTGLVSATRLRQQLAEANVTAPVGGRAR